MRMRYHSSDAKGSGEKVFDYLDGIGLDPSVILDMGG